MDPTLQVGDVLVVEKVTPRVFHGGRHVGNVILFSPPAGLCDIVSANGGRITDRDLFVKRIAAGPGDLVSVDSTGSVQVNGKLAPGRRDLCGAEPLRLIERYIKPTKANDAPSRIGKEQVFVLGDCSSVSIDSRVWGPLDANEIVGRPLFRVWPLKQFGPIPELKMSETDWTQ